MDILGGNADFVLEEVILHVHIISNIAVYVIQNKLTSVGIYNFIYIFAC